METNNGVEIFNKITKEFNLKATIKPDCLVGKYPGFSGALIWHYINTNYVEIATDVARTQNELVENDYFWGADNIYDYEEAKNRTQQLILKIKELQNDTRIKRIDKDFEK